jgi:hypothetical protein
MRFRSGDIERAMMEWRSLLRHIVHAPDLEWDRWRQLKEAAKHFIENTTSPALLDFLHSSRCSSSAESQFEMHHEGHEEHEDKQMHSFANFVVKHP